MLQEVFSKLESFVSEVQLLFSGSILVELMCFQWHLSISNPNPHHTMIGAFLLSASVLSNVQDRNNHHPGVCMPFLCLLSGFTSCEGFRQGIFPIQTIWDS